MNYDIVPMMMLGKGIRFSRGSQPSIMESSVDETARFLGRYGYDFNRNGRIDSQPYAANLNNGKVLEPFVGSLLSLATGIDAATFCPSDDGLMVLEDHDDWAVIERNLPIVVGQPLGEGSWFPEADSVGVIIE